MLGLMVGPGLALRCRAAHPPAATLVTVDGSVRPKPCSANETVPGARRGADAYGTRAGHGALHAPMNAVKTMPRAWRFHAGAPIEIPPAVTWEGDVVVATSDGYVDFLRPDGTLRWSYTVDGAISGAIAVGRRSLIVGTSSGHLVSLSLDGRARWATNIPHAITTRVQPERLGLVFFGVASGRIYGALPNGAAISFDVGGQVSSGPIGLRSGGFALGTSAGRLVLFDRTGIKRAQRIASSALFGLFASPDSTLYALSATSLFAVDPGGQTLWAKSGVRAAAIAGSDVVALEHDGNELEWLDRTGRTLRRVSLAGQASEAPALGPDGLLYVPRVDGRLDGLSKNGVVRTTLDVCHAPLLRPVVDSVRSRLIAAGADGTVVATRLDSNPRARLP
jgi:outer membrane protein assembly factor BamB